MNDVVQFKIIFNFYIHPQIVNKMTTSSDYDPLDTQYSFSF